MNRVRAPGLPLLLILAVAVSLLGCTTAKTLDHDGGVEVTLQASCLPAQPQCALTGLLDTTLGILKTRGEDLGVADTTAQRESGAANRLVVDLPGYRNTALAASTLGSHGELVLLNTNNVEVPVGTTILTNGTYQYPVAFTGAQFDRSAISAEIDAVSSQPTVTFAFADATREAFKNYTRDHLGDYLTIALDGRVIESAVIQSEIDDEGQITGLGSLDEARALAAQLKSGPLPVSLTVVDARLVQPGNG